jgi:hypothetical protein
MIASSPAVPKQRHVVSAPETDTAFPAVHDGHPSSPFTVQHPFALGVEPSLQTYALAESIRDDAHAMSAKHRKRKGVFVNAPPLELLVVLANISVFSFLLRSGRQKFVYTSRALLFLSLFEFVARKGTRKGIF